MHDSMHMIRTPRAAALLRGLSLPPLAALVLAGCGPSDAAPAVAGEVPPATTMRDTAFLSTAALELGGLDTVRADRRPWHAGWTGPARLLMDPTATEALGAIVEGRVASVSVQPGDVVRRGQVIVELHSHEMMDARAAHSAAQAALARARTGYTLATTAADRAERLFAARALSRAEMEAAVAARADAAGALAQAESEMTRASDFLAHLLGEGPVPPGTDPHYVLVRAPFDGVVMARQAEPGAVVTVGAPLVTVSRASALVLVVRIPEQEAEHARQGSTIEFTVAAFPDRRFQARVTRVLPMVDTLTRSIEVRASVPSAGVLRPEMFATAELIGPPSGEVLSLPAEAIQALEGDTVVVTYQPREGGAYIEAVPVRAGRRAAGRVEIVDGLEDGALVVGRGAAVARAELLRRRAAGEAP